MLKSELQFELTIEKLVPGGAGFSRLPDGKAIFVHGAYPGEEVIVEIIEGKKDFARGKCLQILKASPMRKLPLCLYFEQCGGCQWQDIAYTAQLEYKEQITKELWQKSKLDFDLGRLVIHASNEEYEYRHRIQLHHQDCHLGFLEKHTHKIINVKDCPISHPRIRHFLNKNDSINRKNLPSRFHICCNTEGQIFIETLNPEASIKILGKTFIFSPTHFFQNHIGLVKELISVIFTPEFKGKTAVDLYAGVGLFSAFLEDHFEQIYACEENPSAGDFFKKNAPKTQFFPMSVEKFLTKKLPNMEYAILDPPRKGLSKTVISALEKQHFQNIHYVSCDPVTQARDLSLLSHLYRIEEAHLFDFYPQTSHIEMLVKLKHK